jgi:hypothetical protein
LVIILSISIVRELLEIVPRGVLSVYFGDVEVTTLVVGKLGCLLPAVYVSLVVCPYMTNNPIEEEFRLAVPLETPAIDFRHHEAVDA